MKVTEHPSLKALNSFGVESSARLMVTLEQEEDLLTLPRFNPDTDVLLGGGSNVLFASDVPGTILLNRLQGRSIVRQDSSHAWVDAGAGENWNELVHWTLENGLSGLENLTMIPGLAGAAPIQNIGAYGVELASVLDSVTAWDMDRAIWTVFSAKDCQPAYRDSYFKTVEPDRFFITSIRLRLDRRFQPRLDYAGLAKELDAMGISQPNALDVSHAVTRLRRRKLPDPAKLGNAGSFFKNPLLGHAAASALAKRYPDLPQWQATEGSSKCSAAWMIEHCGFKGCRAGDAGVSEKHALVMVNHGNASGAEILELAREIQSTVRNEFDIELQTEPKIIDFRA